MTIKWCHFSDTHLGYRQYGLKDRLNDFTNSAMTCAELMIKQNPNFIIFTGDFFENYRPLPSDYRAAFKLLQIFHDNQIPIYAIRGNHDASYASSKRYGGNVLHFFYELGLLQYLEDDFIVVKDKGKDLVIIAGLGHYGKRTSKRLKELLDKNSALLERQDVPKILMLHAFVEDMVPETQEDLKRYFLNQLPFNYIALGHYHVQWPKDYGNPKNKLFCPGSTEHWSANEWNEREDGVLKGTFKGFYVVEALKDEKKWKVTTEFVKYKVRPKLYIKHDFKMTDLKTVNQTVREIINQNDKKDHLLKVNLRGSLKRGELALLNTNDLRTIAKNVLYFDLITQFSDSSIEIERGLTVREAILDVLRKEFNLKGEELDEYVSLIEDSFNLVDDKEFTNKFLNMIEKFIPRVSTILGDEKKDEGTRKRSKPKKSSQRKKKLKSKKGKSLEGYM